jgi:hypothetical protein
LISLVYSILYLINSCRPLWGEPPTSEQNPEIKTMQDFIDYMAQKKMLSTPVEMCKPFPVLEKFY